jgi:hypothetical protein
VLAVLSDGEESMAATLREAVALAAAGNARLTLVKTCEQGRAYVWVAPFAVGSAYLPAELESPDEAAQVLSRFADQVPQAIPVTTLVLTKDTQDSLLMLLSQAHFGAIVAGADLLSHCRRLRRQLCREQLHTILITSDCAARRLGRITGQLSSSGLKDGAVDADQVSEGRNRRHPGFWPWHARRLAGAGGER